jgi:predicted nucleic acid-binding Zn ribbon protein
LGDDGRQPLVLRECLRVVSKRLGLGGSLEAARLWNSWTEIAGAAIAEHAEPTSLRDGVLRIRTDSPSWATELGYMGAEIARRANAAIGKPIVSEVRIWTAPGPVARPPSSPPTTARIADGRRSAVSGSSSDPTRALARARAAWSRRRGRSA